MALTSRKLDILKALAAHLAGMEVTIGITTWPMTDRVHRGRTRYGDETVLPAISILEAPRQSDGLPAAEEGHRRQDDWTLLVQGWVPDDKDHPTDPAYEFEAQVVRRLAMMVEVKSGSGQPRYPDVYRIGGRVIGMTIGPGVVRPPQDQVSDKAFFYLPLTLRIGVDVTDPFVEV